MEKRRCLAQLNTARERALVAERIRCKFPELKAHSAAAGDRICAGRVVRLDQIGGLTASAEYQEGYASDNYD